ncbi:MAG: TIGR03617 family F420-dependent LLM class oxidoreductase, partial [Armatimonadetes bacterium]|nr:TIGR03617 family F420-dependent LLM class oxidoreductase [Armatimonadota bacterium]
MEEKDIMMRIDAAFDAHALTATDIARLAGHAEALGIDGLWTHETAHDPFLPLALAAGHSTRLELGTSVAVAFARSPVVLAHTAWDLARLSGGRFILGLGTQVKPHIERRFGMSWGPPAPRLREFVEAIRAVWRCWQEDAPLNYRGRFYTHTLMTPFFNPGPIPHPRVPIYIAGVNPVLCRLAGEIADGFHVHPCHTVRYLQEVVLPSLARGLERAGRPRQTVQVAVRVFAVAGRTAEERDASRRWVRQQIAFYASTPTYRVVLATHGWEEVAEQLSRMARHGRWEEMGDLITDEILDAVAVTGDGDDLAARTAARYAGLADRIGYYLPFVPGQDDERWRALVAAARPSDSSYPS